MEIYFVAICKGDYVCSLECGPFLSKELAKIELAVKKFTDPQRTSCYWSVVSSELAITIVEKGEFE